MGSQFACYCNTLRTQPFEQAMHPLRVWISALRAGDQVASADIDLTIRDEMQAKLGGLQQPGIRWLSYRPH